MHARFLRVPWIAHQHFPHLSLLLMDFEAMVSMYKLCFCVKVLCVSSSLIRGTKKPSPNKNLNKIIDDKKEDQLKSVWSVWDLMCFFSLEKSAQNIRRGSRNPVASIETKPCIVANFAARTDWQGFVNLSRIWAQKFLYKMIPHFLIAEKIKIDLFSA